MDTHLKFSVSFHLISFYFSYLSFSFVSLTYGLESIKPDFQSESVRKPTGISFNPDIYVYIPRTEGCIRFSNSKAVRVKYIPKPLIPALAFNVGGSLASPISMVK